MPKVSVCVPIYNVEKYIEKCARSLFEQTLDDIEYIFVNDCTPDKSISILKQVLKEYPHRQQQVKIISHQSNMGSAAARNTCLSAATGEYIGWCDSDDWVESCMYQCLYNEAIDNHADIVCCNIWKEYSKYRQKLCYPYSIECKEDLMRIGNQYSALWNKLIRSTLYKSNHIQFYHNVNMWDDEGVTCRLRYLSNKTVVVHKELYHYNKQNEQSIVSRPSRRKIEEQILCAKYLAEFFNITAAKIPLIVSCIKFESKLALIWDPVNRDIIAWKKTFPETNSYIWKYPMLSWPVKFTLMLAFVFPKIACLLIDWNHRQNKTKSI